MKKFYLYVISNGANSGKFSISKSGGLTIGRSKDNQIIVNSVNISKKHCKLKYSDQEILYVTDLQSTNGTYINGKRIAAGAQVPLNDGDSLTFSDKDFSNQILIEQKVQQTHQAGINIKSTPLSSSESEKKCQFCGEKILEQAEVCKHCGREQISDVNYEKYIDEIKGQPLLNLLVFIVSVAFISIQWWISVLIIIGYATYHWFYHIPKLKEKPKVEIVRLYEEKIAKKRNNKIMYVGGLLGLVIVLIITNPTKDDFKTFLKDNIAQIITNETGLSNSFSSTIIGAIDNILPSQFDSFIVKKNLVIFSIYSIDISLLDSTDNRINTLQHHTK